MKQLLNKIINVALLFLGVGFIFFACEEGPNFVDYSHYYAEATANGISPNTGYAGQEVTITGTNLDTLTGAVKVWFGGIQATTIVNSNGTNLVVEVPVGAVSGSVSLQVWTTKIDSLGWFTVLPSSIISGISPERGKPGDEAIINGENFGNDINNVQLLIGDVVAQVIAVSDNEIKFIVPDTNSGVLVLKIGSQVIEGPYFLIGADIITGTLIGHTSSWGDNSATYISAAVDGDMATFVDAPNKIGYVGYDLGTGKAAALTSIRYAPRSSHPQRMVGGEIRGANDASLYDFVTLFTITETPPTDVYTEVELSIEESYRYIYYYSTDGYCNIAEIEFYGNIIDVVAPLGKLVYEFNDPAATDYWVGTHNSINVIENGKLKVSFDAAQFAGTSKRRADLNFVEGGIFPASTPNGKWHYAIEYPILAMKISFTGTGAPIPGTGNIKLDRFDGAKNNAYLTDFLSSNVLYYDCSIALTENQDLASFTFKIADVSSTEETGYEVDWIRSFKTVAELQSFLGK